MWRLTYAFALGCCLLATCATSQSCSFTTQRVQCGDLACDMNLHVCVHCRSDSDCYPSAVQCSLPAGKCKLRSFVDNFGSGTLLAMLGAFAVCSIAVIAGVGGGGILVPLFCILLQVPMQSAVGLSQSTICGQSTLNMYLSVLKHPSNPQSKRTLNYQYLSLLLPLGLVGTLLGGILSRVSPDMLRLLLLFGLLSGVLVLTIKKVRAQYAQDAQQRETYTALEMTSVEGKPVTNPSRQCPPSDEAANRGGTHDIGVPAGREEYLPLYPQKVFLNHLACFIVLFVANLIRSFTQCPSVLYWACICVPVAMLCTMFYYEWRFLRFISIHEPEHLMFEWNTKNTFFFPLVAITAGAAASMLGIGGGLVLGFVLYEVGLSPQEASVTSGTATFFIAFSSALDLLVNRKLAPDYGVIFFFIGMASTALGSFVFLGYIQKHGLLYLIVAALALVVGGSLVVLGAFGIYNAVITFKGGGSVGAFGALCRV